MLQSFSVFIWTSSWAAQLLLVQPSEECALLPLPLTPWGAQLGWFGLCSAFWPLRRSALTGCLVGVEPQPCVPRAALGRSSDSLLGLETHCSYLQGKHSDCCLLPPWGTISAVPSWLQTWLIPLTTFSSPPQNCQLSFILWSFSNMLKSNGGGWP